MKRERWDGNRSDTRKIWMKMVRDTFIREGTMVAFPTCFPGVTTPIPADESRITALDVTADGVVYGGTAGHHAHLFVANLRGAAGIVLDLGVVDEADACVSVFCGHDVVIAAFNDGNSGRLVKRAFQPLRYDLLQEWSFPMEPIEVGDPVVAGERIVHAVRDPSRTLVLGTTENHLFRYDFASGETRIVAELPARGRLGVNQHAVYGRDTGAALWRYDLASAALKRNAITLPTGTWEQCPDCWACDPQGDTLFVADDKGALFEMSETKEFGEAVATLPLAPVGPMAFTRDGRLFGFCGETLSHLFCYSRHTGDMTDLGAAVSVIHTRRYGYQYGAAITGPDGEIYFGENDDLGHLWVYFPSVGNM